MAAGVSATGGVLLIDQYNITAQLREVGVTAEMGTYDGTTLGDTSRSRVQGIKTGGIQLSALFSRTAGHAYDVFKSAFGSATPKIATFYPEGMTIGYPCATCYASETRFDNGLSYDDLISCAAYLESAEDAVDFGVSLHALGAETADVNSASVDNGAATTNGGVAVLHFTAKSGTITDGLWTIQHSSNNSTWADLVTFNTGADNPVGGERSEVAAGATVNRYLRAALSGFSGSGSPSVTYAIAFARR